MANRRDLTDRNREQRQPLQPIDFCQGLPFKVRWMGRDAQTGRDLVQFPDGSIVRAGKRMFSGNCPRGTMVDVVDCGANGVITIDWRDAEIRQPLMIPEVPTDWKMIIDTGYWRNLPMTIDQNYLQFLSPFIPDIVKYFENIKQGQKVLLLQYSLSFYRFTVDRDKPSIMETLATTTKKMHYFTEPHNGTVRAVTTLDPVTTEEIAAHDQIWITSDGDYGHGIGFDVMFPETEQLTSDIPAVIPESVANMVLAADKKIFLLVDKGSLFQTSPPVSFDRSQYVTRYNEDGATIMINYERNRDRFYPGYLEGDNEYWLRPNHDLASYIIKKKYNYLMIEGAYRTGPPNEIGVTGVGAYFLPPDLTILSANDPLLEGVTQLFGGVSSAKINIPPGSGFVPLITTKGVRNNRFFRYIPDYDNSGGPSAGRPRLISGDIWIDQFLIEDQPVEDIVTAAVLRE